jgi:hypothetical protein
VGRTLREMNDTKDLEQRKLQSEILKNLFDSLGVIYGAMTDMMMAGDMPGLLDYDDD